MTAENPRHLIQFEVSAFLADRAAADRTAKTLEFYSDKLTRWQTYLTTRHVSYMQEITPDVLRETLIHLHDSHTPGGVTCYWRAIKVFLNWYDRETENWANPVRKITPPKPPRTVIDGVPPEHIKAVLATCHTRGWEDVRDRALISILYDTGARRDELISMNYADLDLARGTIVIQRGKGRKRRLVCFGNKSRLDLTRYLRGRDLRPDSPLWLNRYGKRLGAAGLRSMLDRRHKRAKLPGPPHSPHDFRRACGLALHRLKVPLYSIQTVLGHTSRDVTRLYVALTDDDLRRDYKSPVDAL
jgi:integrase/recombinase XerD